MSATTTRPTTYLDARLATRCSLRASELYNVAIRDISRALGPRQDLEAAQVISGASAGRWKASRPPGSDSSKAPKGDDEDKGIDKGV